jgi:hypothetical protein
MLVLLWVAGPGCRWRSYPEILNVHLDVLTQTAAKLIAVAQSPRGLQTEGMGEYTYPSRRARAFLADYQSYRDRPSHRQLTAFLDRYDSLVERIDAARVNRKPIESAVLTTELNELLQMSAAIRGMAVDGG